MRGEPFFGVTARQRWTMALSIFVVLTFSEIFMKPFSGGSVEPNENALVRALYYPAYGIGLWLAWGAPWDTCKGVLRTPLIWVLVAWAFASAYWSIDPSGTDRRAVALLFTTFCGTVMAARLSWRDLTKALAASFTIIAVGSLIAAVALPGFGRMKTEFPGAWSGLFIEKNGMGAAAAQAIVFCAGAFVLDRPRRWMWTGGAVAAAVVLLGSTSKTSLVVGLIGCLAFAFAWAVRRGPIAAVIATFFGVIGVGALGFAVAFAPEVLLGALGKDATLTGRTRIWAAVMRQIAKQPQTGFGYGAVWRDESGWGPAFWVAKEIESRPAYAHNGWIEVWLGMGIYAVWTWAVLLAITWVATLAATYRRSDAYLALPFLTMFTLTNLTESSIAYYNSIGWVLFVTFATKLMLPGAPSSSPSAKLGEHPRGGGGGRAA